MKKVINYLYIILLFITSIFFVSAKSNPYPKMEENIFGGEIINCTWYAWQQAKDRMGVELPLWYYVETWYSKAEKAGYSVGKEPKKDSLMVWDYGEGWGGHVSYVVEVEGDTVYYIEGGSPMTEDGINSGYLNMDEMSSFLVGFIYLDQVPTPKKETPTNNKTETTPKPVETPKSSNNYLKELNLSTGIIEFNKDTLEYNIEVPNEVEELTITSIPEDEKSTITGNDTYQLQEGQNKITITVKAENEEVKEYILNVTRQVKVIEEEKENESQDSIKEEPSENNRIKLNKKIIISIIVGTVLFTILIIILALTIHKNHKKK